MINYLFEAVGYTYKRNDAGIYDVLDEILLIDKLSKNHYVTLYAIYHTLGVSKLSLTNWRRVNKVETGDSTFGTRIDPVADLIHWGLISEIKLAEIKNTANSIYGATAKGQRILQLIEATMQKTAGTYVPPVSPNASQLNSCHSSAKYDYECAISLLTELKAEQPELHSKVLADISEEIFPIVISTLDSFGVTGSSYQILFSFYKGLDIGAAAFKNKEYYELIELGCIKAKKLTNKGREVIAKVLQIKEALDTVNFTENKLLNKPSTLLSKLVMSGNVPTNSSKKTLVGFYPYAEVEGIYNPITGALTLHGLALQKRISEISTEKRARAIAGLTQWGVRK